MRVTIKDVAKLAGVAPSTVTRVIQNKSTISDETKKRVREAMVELDYHPNLNARSLVSQSSQVIALVLPIDSDVFYQNPFFPTVLRGITQIASDNDYAIQICTGQNEERRLDNLKQLIYGNRVDGLIFLYAQEEDPLVKLVADEQFPFLILGKSLSPFIPLVDNDNVQAGFDATEYFIKKGCKRIAFIGGTKRLFVTLDRLTGYEQALQEHNLPLDTNLTYFATEFLEDNGYRFSRLLFKHNPNIDAIITIDSLLAAGVCDYIAKHQLDVPVLSFDSVNPKLNLAAYVDINSLELGRVSFETILQIINDAKSNKQICYRQLIAHKIIEK